MKRILILLFVVMMTVSMLVGCSQEKATQNLDKKKEKEIISEKEKKKQLQEKQEAELEYVVDEFDESNIIAKENLFPIDFDLFYFMDQDIDFLTMKCMGLPSEDEAYYVNKDCYGSEVRFYLAKDEYTINRITLLDGPEDEARDYYETPSFMGLYLGMPMELAKEYVQKESPEYDGELEVKYSDDAGDGIVHQIDVFSKKELIKRIQGEDFYFKFFDMNIHNEADHLGDNTGAQENLEIDEKNKTYTYHTKFGSDEYQKVYTYNFKNTIQSMEIKSDQDEFLAVVPSLFGIQLASKKEEITQMVESANKNIINSKVAKTNDSKYDIEEYTIIDNPSRIVYTAEVYIDKANQKVKKIKGYFKHKKLENQDELFELLEKELEGSPKKIKGSGAEKWIVDFEAYSDKIIKSVAIYGEEDSSFVNIVPAICGLQLNMFEIGVHNTLLNNGFEILSEERYQPFEDKNLETIKYTVRDLETKKEFNIYINSKYIGDISAAVIVNIAISYI